METTDYQSLPSDILSAADAERLATQYRPVVCFDDFFLVEYGYRYYDSHLDQEVSYPCIRYFFNKDPKQPTVLHSVFFGPITEAELRKLKQSFSVYSRMSC